MSETEFGLPGSLTKFVPREFTSWEVLVYEVRLEPMECPLCGKLCKSNQGLGVHWARVHTSEPAMVRPACEAIKCDRSTKGQAICQYCYNEMTVNG